jgi:DNA modification methylase
MAIEQWRNRITGHGEESPEQLLANPRNFRIHPKSQQDALQGVLEEVGIVDEVIVNERTGFLVNGHLRVTLAMRTEQPTIPVKYVDLSEAEEALILATFDPISALAVTDAAILDDLLRDVRTGSEAVQEMLAGLAEGAGLYQGNPAGAGGDEFDATPDEGPTRTQLGDLWQLGEHRLLVGDCTVAANVARLMGGALLDLIATDPPYGVSYADKNRFLNVIAPANRIQEPIANDHGKIEDIAHQVWKPAFDTMCAVARAGCVMYCHAPQGGDQMMMMMMMMMEADWPVRHELIWLKNNHVLGRADYAYKHEPILYAWKAGGHRYYGGFQTSVLEFNKPQKSDLHPTMKPIALVSQLIESSSLAGEVVGDWFLGSGTTIIACERLNRKCYGCEIEPKYADVILRRWEAETGKEAELAERLSNDSTIKKADG